MQDRNNSVDCGVFVCCYAYVIFKLKDDLVFTNIEQRSQVNGCFHVKCKMDCDPSLFNFNMSCISKWQIDMKQLMDVLENDVKSEDSYKKFFDYISEPKTLQKISMKKKRGRRGKTASKSYTVKNLNLRNRRKGLRQICIKILILMKDKKKMESF